MRVKSKTVRRKVNLLQQPKATFVSLVDYGANQTPFTVVKRANGVKIMKKKRPDRRVTKRGATAARSRKARTAAAPVKKTDGKSAIAPAVLKLTFDRRVYKTKEAVVAFLEKNQWEGFDIDDSDKGEIVVHSTEFTEYDLTNVREVTVKRGITAYVGKIVDEDGEEDAEKTSKARRKAAPKVEDAADEETTDDHDGDGEADDTDEDADEDGDDDDTSEDDEDEESDDDADEDDDEDDASDEDEEETDLDEDGNPRNTEEEDFIDEEFGGTTDPDEDEDDEADRISDVIDEDGNYVEYADRRNALDGRNINDREADEPDEDDLPGQGKGPRGPGATTDPGRPGKFGKRVKRTVKTKGKRKPAPKVAAKGKKSVAKSAPQRRRIVKTKISIPALDQYVRKYDSYGAYLSGGTSLTDVLADGMVDGVPPGVNVIFEGMYKAVGNTLKNSENVTKDINVIASEFSEGVLALHAVWKKLLKSGNAAQKAAAKKYFKALGAALQTSASANIATAAIEAAVSKAVAPIHKQLSSANRLVEQLKKGVPSRRSLGNDDVTQTRERSAKQRDEDEDREWMRKHNRKAVFGTAS